MSRHEAGRELDALVAEKVMGLAVLAQRPVAIFVEGEWSIHLDSEGTEGWACYAEHAPVYARATCNCSEPLPERTYDSPEKAELYRELDAYNREQRAKEVAAYGHRSYCLSVVPEYSTNIRAAWDVVEKVGGDWEIERAAEDGECRATVWNVQVGADGLKRACVHRTLWCASAPLAICRAALQAVGADAP